MRLLLFLGMAEAAEVSGMPRESEKGLRTFRQPPNFPVLSAAERETAVAEIHKATSAATDRRLRALQVENEPPLVRGVLQTLAYLDAALREIKKRRADDWCLAWLSLLGLEHIVWNSERERRTTRDVAFADAGALWWARLFDVKPWNQSPPLPWESFRSEPSPHEDWAMCLGPYFAPMGPSWHGCNVEVWAGSRPNQTDLGTRKTGWGWPFTLDVVVFQASKVAGGSTRGALPTRSCRIRLVRPQKSALHRERLQHRAALEAVDELAPYVPVEQGVEWIVDGTPTQDTLLLVLAYLLRHQLLTPRYAKRAEKSLEVRLYDRVPSLPEDEVRQLAASIRTNFRNPRQPKGLSEYLAKAERRKRAATDGELVKFHVPRDT